MANALTRPDGHAKGHAKGHTLAHDEDENEKENESGSRSQGFWYSTLCNVSPHSRHVGGNLFSLLPQAMAISTDRRWLLGGTGSRVLGPESFVAVLHPHRIASQSRLTFATHHPGRKCGAPPRGNRTRNYGNSRTSRTISFMRQTCFVHDRQQRPAMAA